MEATREVLVYTRKGCHLCEIVKESLVKLERRGLFRWHAVAGPFAVNSVSDSGEGQTSAKPSRCDSTRSIPSPRICSSSEVPPEAL